MSRPVLTRYVQLLSIEQRAVAVEHQGMHPTIEGPAMPTSVTVASPTHSKFFRIAVEGATTDGRTIQRAWIEQMAANYNPHRYGARVNLEHIRGILPDSPFKAYGDVVALEAREETGEFAGRLGLYARISPTPELIALTKARQKIYTSCEIDPSFADTKAAYLIGLAITDSPASLGTEVLSFAAQNPAASPFAARKLSPANLFTAAAETVIELEPAEASATPLLSKIAEMLGFTREKSRSDDARIVDLTQAVTALAGHGAQQADAMSVHESRLGALETALATLTADGQRDRQAFADLRAQLAATGDAQPVRPMATGSSDAVTTHC
jgi:hypothetical protein